MRKIFCLGLALALIESLSFPARAELFKNIKTDASIETRSFSADNLQDRNGATDDHRGQTNFRMILGGSFDLLDDVHSRLLIDRSSRQADSGTKGENLNTIQSDIFLDNAYVKIDKVFGHVDLTIGRQFYGNSDDLNIYFGPNNDSLLTTASADLFRADANLGDWAKFQGIAGQTAVTTAYSTGVPANTNTDVWGAEVNTDKVVPKGNLAAYYYTAQTHTTKVAPATGNNTLVVTGGRIGGDVPMVSGLGYNAEILQNFGRNNLGTGPAVNPNPAYEGNAYFIGVNYGRSDMAAGYPIRAKLEYGRGSRDFAAILPGRRFGIIWGRFSNVATATGDPSTINRGNGGSTGLSNLKVIDAGVGTTCPKTHIGLDLNWYRFMYDANGAAAVTYTGGTSAGTEYDLILSYKHSENVSFELNAATFQVGTSLQNTASTGTSPITQLGADVKIKI